VERLPAGQGPLLVFDAGYDPVQLGQGLAGTGAAILVRLRAGRCFSADPPPAPRSHKAAGPPPRRQARHRRPDQLAGADRSARQRRRPVRHRHGGRMGGLHPKQQLHPTRGTKRPRPIVRGTLIGVQVSRIPARTRPPKVPWLWWQGPGTPDLEVLWRAYVRRFDLEHTIRFCEQTLG
jgi:hypothetical protein